MTLPLISPAHRVKLETIADFRVAYIGLNFESDEKEEYLELSERLRSSKDNLRRYYPTIKQGRAFFSDVKRYALIEGASTKTDGGPATRFINLVNRRTKLLTNSTGRFRFLVDDDVIALVRRHKSLTFHKRTEACIKIAQGYRRAGVLVDVHSSALTMSERSSILRRFGTGQLDVAP